ncbi:MAG: hypothetical protein WCS91_05720 [Bacilli bacterium]
MEDENKKIEKIKAPKKARRPLSKKAEGWLYSGIALLAVAIASITIVTLTRSAREKAQLAEEETKLQEEYEDLAKKHEDLSDPDYAQVYFNQNNVYIPTKDIIIEYKP